MGAPRKNPPKDAVESIERLAAQGHSIIGISKQLGVSKPTFKRWCEEDEAFQEAFEIGRETERQALHSLIVQSAVQNKPANANAMFLLKARHGYREFDSPNAKPDVAVVVAPVMIVRDHGTDEQWAAKVAEQQRQLTQEAQTRAPSPLALPEPSNAPLEPSCVPLYDVPTWRGRA
jgi:AcrR family transcriptional regulator